MRFSKKVLAAAAVAGMMFAGTPAIAQEIPTFSLEEIIFRLTVRKRIMLIRQSVLKR
ncbi:hypothetical protein M7775_02645 [Sporomusa sphaeroides DSM 2875]|uniref:hypothetical protein n=1 Tax=Sporomusa sphaeroides TaxID=47679 RepID=UPI002030F01E|nr:hypothetical protein [Sporomusa sphaeroides]MCM0757466.1 hypothetical protein [Sporomusa sphaeroides DSM 2875]